MTGTELAYEGSITIDESLLEKADIFPGEQVHVLNINNGQRLVTYTISAPKESGTVLLNGAAARLGSVGDKVIIIPYCQITSEKVKELKIRKIFVDEKNSQRSLKMDPALKAKDVVVGFHPAGYRIDKTAEAMNRYTKWDVMRNHWRNPKPVCFDSLPQSGWIAKDKFDWKDVNLKTE